MVGAFEVVVVTGGGKAIKRIEATRGGSDRAMQSGCKQGWREGIAVL